MALAFSGYILYTAFRGYYWMFMQMQSGTHQYPGNTNILLHKLGGGANDLQNQYGNTTLFLGMLMSTMVFGWLSAFTLLFLTLSLLMFAELWITLWQFRIVLLFFAVTKLVLILLRVLVIDRILNEDGWITWPMTFTCVWVILMILNFAIGLLASVCRFFILLPFMLLRFNTLDDTMMPALVVNLDAGYYSLLGLTYTSYEQMNPICRSFISSLSPSAHRLYSASYKTNAEVCNWDHGQSSFADDGGEPASAEVVERAQRRQILRNKLWLAVLLMKNPTLRQSRKSAAQGVERMLPEASHAHFADE